MKSPLITVVSVLSTSGSETPSPTLIFNARRVSSAIGFGLSTRSSLTTRGGSLTVDPTRRGQSVQMSNTASLKERSNG